MLSKLQSVIGERVFNLFSRQNYIISFCLFTFNNNALHTLCTCTEYHIIIIYYRAILYGTLLVKERKGREAEYEEENNKIKIAVVKSLEMYERKC